LREVTPQPAQRLQTAGTLAAHLPRAVELLRAVHEDDSANRLERLHGRLDDPVLRVVVFGEFNRGKSTLINALLGRFVLPAKLVPTTGHVTSVVHGAEELVRIRLLDGQTLTCGLNELEPFAILSRGGVAREDVESIEVVVAAPLLAGGLTLIDTPGVNEQEAQTRRAQGAIALADLVLLVLDTRQLLGESEQKLAIDWLTQQLGKPVILVVNFMNLVDEQERPALRERLGRWCRAHMPVQSGRGWFEVNALGALAHALGKRPPPDDDFERLRSHLAHCVPGREIRLRQLLVDIEECRQHNAGTLRELSDNLAKVAEARAQRRDLLVRLVTRLEAEVPVERERLANEARKVLSEQLEALVYVCLTGRERPMLEAHAVAWYQDYLGAAIQTIERRAAELVQFLAGEHLRRPELFTVRERMVLNARPTLPMIDPADGDMAFRISVGEAIGTFVLPLPLVGEKVGQTLRGWLAHYLSFEPCSYADACVQAARARWQADAEQAQAIVLEQYDARAAALRQELSTQLEVAESALAVATEQGQREELEIVLEQCAATIRP
jgi:small GTP-binding protein